MSTIPSDYSVAFVTAPDSKVAKDLAHRLVEQRLVACVNIVPSVTSIYAWEGEVKEDAEVLMMVKTRTDRMPEVTRFVRENHPYSVAEVISLPIADGNALYLEWMGKSVPEAASTKRPSQ
uniref:Uncharacterized protein n=1 Tax=Anopheles farauti TaxID=69004 RepID=A0A182Q1F3_9DIPT